MSFAEQRFESVPSTLISMVLGLVWTKTALPIRVQPTCSDTERQGAECPRGGVRITAHDRHSRQGKALLGSDNMHDALPDIVHAEQGDAEGAAIVFERVNLVALTASAIGRRRSVVGTL